MKYTILNQNGAAVVEFAVIASILFVILFAILEFGFIFMQEHFVANAAREGMRVGIRANNFEEFTELGDESTDIYNFSDGCDESNLDRALFVDCQVRNYLETFYRREDVGTIVYRLPEDPDGNPAVLAVQVKVPNFYPPILSSLAALLPGTGFTLPENISFKTTGEYEDPDEL